jgi:hypothetical protein
MSRSLDRRLDFTEYEKLYEAVSRDVTGIDNRGRSGTNSPVGLTKFPPIFTPGPAALAELTAEKVGYWNIPGHVHDTAKLAQIIGHMGEQSGAVYKITIGRDDLKVSEMGAPINARTRASQD